MVQKEEERRTRERLRKLGGLAGLTKVSATVRKHQPLQRYPQIFRPAESSRSCHNFCSFLFEFKDPQSRHKGGTEFKADKERPQEICDQV